jgi:geranylgeranyl diphosphate synthase type II
MSDRLSTTHSDDPPQVMVDLRSLVEDYLEGIVFSRDPSTARLAEAMRYSLMAGGKRIRPVLALATADAISRPPASVLPLAAALEMIHTHSLVHDDLPAMDNDELRRGKPTAHVAFGEDVALLAGDALLAEAVALVLREQQGEAALVLEAVKELARAVGVTGLVGGQYIDVSATSELDQKGLRHMHELKTGRLLAAAVGTVLTLAGESGRASAELRAFGAEVGVLFQIVDDILDVTGSHETLGKSCGSDARRGRRTYVSMFGLDRARQLAQEAHASAREALERTPEDTSTLEQITDYVLTRSR